ncbi:helix-turn-helix domain-containing protein [Aliarcobacter butzleri]|uniref:helix-turn-helix domain-containing protein n=1 Tax=Aliarcobacter butzleri TaxID=28197 RepID=UPI003AF87D89
MINYNDLIKISKRISNPFSREIFFAEIKEEFGNGYTIFYDLGNGIAVFVRNFIPKKDFILVEECNIAGTSFIFNLSSNITFIYKDKEEYILKKNHFFIEIASDKFYCEVPLKKAQPFTMFFIGMKEELFLKIAYPIKDIQEYMKKAFKQSYYILKESQIDTLQSELFNDFKDENSFEDILKTINLESKTTNLIHYTIKKISKILNNQTLDSSRISSLQRAKEIIMKEYNNPNLTIKNIAYKSAINECYLKKDFKEYYGMTILEMLQKRRLEIAKELLKENFALKEVITKIGYKHIGHFNKLFFDNFGISPSNYKKQLNNSSL